MSITDARVYLAGFYWLFIRKIFYWENRRIHNRELKKLSDSLRGMKLKKDEDFGYMEKVCATCERPICTCTVGTEFESQESSASGIMPDGADSSIGIQIPNDP